MRITTSYSLDSPSFSAAVVRHGNVKLRCTVEVTFESEGPELIPLDYVRRVSVGPSATVCKVADVLHDVVSLAASDRLQLQVSEET